MKHYYLALFFLIICPLAAQHPDIAEIRAQAAALGASQSIAILPDEDQQIETSAFLDLKESDGTSASTRGDCITAIQISQSSIPFTISAPGNYCLVEDVVVNRQVNAITINADNVFLNLNDRAINGLNTGISGIVINGRRGVTITNGGILNFPNSGVLVIQGSSQIILNTLTLGRCGNGIAGFGMNSCLLRNCISAGSLTNGFFINNSTLNNSQNIALQDCVSFASSGPGFVFISCVHMLVIECISYGNRGNGFFQQAQSAQVVYDECVANNNAGHGFFIEGRDNTIQASLADNNLLDGIRTVNGPVRISACQAQSNRSGFHLVSGRGSTILNCTSRANADTGFFTGAETRDLQARSNTALINGQFGFNNLGVPNFFYANFANSNPTNFAGIPNFVVSPTPLTPINFTTNIAN
jgi:hypothetical protein